MPSQRAYGSRKRPGLGRVQRTKPELPGAGRRRADDGDVTAVGRHGHGTPGPEGQVFGGVEDEVRRRAAAREPRTGAAKQERREAAQGQRDGQAGPRARARVAGGPRGSPLRSRAAAPPRRWRCRPALPAAPGARPPCRAAACEDPCAGIGSTRRRTARGVARGQRVEVRFLASPRPRSRRSPCRRRRGGGRSGSPTAGRRRTTRPPACRRACPAPARATCRRRCPGSRRPWFRCGPASGTPRAPRTRRSRRWPRRPGLGQAEVENLHLAHPA